MSKKSKKEKSIGLTKEQAHDFVRIVRDDLQFLREQSYEQPSRTDVRISSSILRRLLYDQMYQFAWTISGLSDEPRIEAVDLADVVSNLKPHHIQYAYAGGAKTRGAHHKGYVLLSTPKAEAEVEGYEQTANRISKNIKLPERRLFSLSEFCLSPSVISGTATISRLDVLRYVANKLGGVHWDNKRGGWSDPVGSRHRLLDEKHMMVGRLSAPFYEAVSIAQDVGSASDTAKFIENADTLFPEEEVSENKLRFREGRGGNYAEMTYHDNKQTDST